MGKRNLSILWEPFLVAPQLTLIPSSRPLSARAPIEVLQEIKAQRPDLCEKMEIYVDGGIRRGTDVLKALCLGAKAVGVGRPFLYAQSAYGVDGVVKAYESEWEKVGPSGTGWADGLSSMAVRSLARGGGNGDEVAGCQDGG